MGYVAIYFFLIFFTLYPHYKNPMDYLLLASFVVLFYLYGLRKSAFFIDTQGEAITIQLKDYLSFKPFNHDFRNRMEFPKYKLIDYKFERGLFGEKLIFELNSKRTYNNRQKLSINIVMFGSAVTKEIIQELELIKSKNQENSTTINPSSNPS